MTREEAYAWIDENIEFVRMWIQENLFMLDQARKITGQSQAGIKQSVNTGKIKPFVRFGEKRKTSLYKLDELIEYAQARIEYMKSKRKM